MIPVNSRTPQGLTPHPSPLSVSLPESSRGIKLTPVFLVCKRKENSLCPGSTLGPPLSLSPPLPRTPQAPHAPRPQREAGLLFVSPLPASSWDLRASPLLPALLGSPALHPAASFPPRHSHGCQRRTDFSPHTRCLGPSSRGFGRHLQWSLTDRRPCTSKGRPGRKGQTLLSLPRSSSWSRNEVSGRQLTGEKNKDVLRAHRGPIMKLRHKGIHSGSFN